MARGEKEAIRPVVVASFGTQDLAALAAARLAAEGVPVLLENGMADGFFKRLAKATAGVRLLVPAVVAELAATLLRAEYAGAVEYQAEVSSAAGGNVCPECGAPGIENLRQQPRSGIWSSLRSLPLRL